MEKELVKEAVEKAETAFILAKPSEYALRSWREPLKPALLAFLKHVKEKGPSAGMRLKGLEAFIAEVQKIKIPEGASSSQRWMHLGAQAHNSRETDAAFDAMLSQLIQELEGGK